MKKYLIVLDAAHGEDTPGKRSPDGRFREYRWSRERISELKIKLKNLGYEVFESNNTNREIGLSKRVSNTNKIQKKKIFISLHVDAAGMGKEWMNPKGHFSAFTTPGQNNSDKVAEIILNNLEKDFPELKGRFDTSDRDKDKEANFQVLRGVNCPAVLIEWLFQDAKAHVDLLLDSNYNSRFVDSLIKSIEEINNTL